MEITLERVERLREKSGLSYEEARALLERCHGDLLDALIELERQGRLRPGGGGTYSTRPGVHPAAPPSGSSHRERSREEGKRAHTGDTFRKQVREGLRAAAELLRPSSGNQLEICRTAGSSPPCPFSSCFWRWCSPSGSTLPLLLIGLVAGCRYRLSGPHVDREVLNGALGAVSDTVEDWKEAFCRRPPKIDHRSGPVRT